MKRPMTLFLLLVFAAVQIYFAKLPISHQVQGSTWIDVGKVPGGLVRREGEYYLVGAEKAFQLHANGVHITMSPVSLSWMDIPQPSGQGIWHLALGAQMIPLVGIGGLVYPAPNGQSVIWVDQGTARAYVSSPATGALNPLDPGLVGVKRALWAQDSHALALLGQGPNGAGLYVWDGDHNLVPVILPNGTAQIAQFGFTRKEAVVAVLNTGRVVWQGHGLIQSLPALNPVAVASEHASVLGMTANQVIFWHDGQKISSSRPDEIWQGAPRFSSNGEMAAILARTMDGQQKLLLYGLHHHWAISVPYPNTPYHLIGFLGNHWVLVTVPSGNHAGTYAWWISG
ncbi:MAG: hypothetical protein ACYCT0_08275 [Sulfobacillus sp.]